MLARDWYYNERRQLGLDSAVASIYDRHDDSDIRARAALTMLGVQRGWRVADIGCGNGVLAEKAREARGAAEAADARGKRLRPGCRGPAGERQRRLEARIAGQESRQCGSFRRAAEDQNAKRHGHGR